jgi:hypothetical protein
MINKFQVPNAKIQTNLKNQNTNSKTSVLSSPVGEAGVSECRSLQSRPERSEGSPCLLSIPVIILEARKPKYFPKIVIAGTFDLSQNVWPSAKLYKANVRESSNHNPNKLQVPNAKIQTNLKF